MHLLCGAIHYYRKLGLGQALVALAWNQESVILSDSEKKATCVADRVIVDTYSMSKIQKKLQKGALFWKRKNQKAQSHVFYWR